MSEWAAGACFLLGALWSVPAWFFGKAAGIGQSRRLMGDDRERLARRRDSKDAAYQAHRENGGW